MERGMRKILQFRKTLNYIYNFRESNTEALAIAKRLKLHYGMTEQIQIS